MKQFSKPQWLSLSDKPYVFYVPTCHGLLPVFPSDKLQRDEMAIESKIDVDDVFEKVVLR